MPPTPSPSLATALGHFLVKCGTLFTVYVKMMTNPMYNNNNYNNIYNNTQLISTRLPNFEAFPILKMQE